MNPKAHPGTYGRLFRIRELRQRGLLGGVESFQARCGKIPPRVESCTQDQHDPGNRRYNILHKEARQLLRGHDETVSNVHVRRRKNLLTVLRPNPTAITTHRKPMRRVEAPGPLRTDADIVRGNVLIEGK